MGMFRASSNNRFRWLSLYFTLFPAEMCCSLLAGPSGACLWNIADVVVGFYNDFWRSILFLLGNLTEHIKGFISRGVGTCCSAFYHTWIDFISVFAVEAVACIYYVLSGSFNRLVFYRQGFAKVGVKLDGIVLKAVLPFPTDSSIFFTCGVELNP